VVGVTVIVGHPIVSDTLTEPVQPFESVALTVNVDMPVLVGVPESRPPLESVRPVGSVPVLLNVTVPIPPVWENCWLYAVPAVPFERVEGLTVMVGHVMVRVTLTLPAQPPLGVAVTVIGKLPVWVGVPLRSPEFDRLIPVGKVPVNVNVEPDGVNWVE
jgi:hypothetical protein